MRRLRLPVGSSLRDIAQLSPIQNPSAQTFIVITIIITWLIGPLAFWILTKQTTTNKMFPASLAGAIGDTLFLPLFNGLSIHFGVLTKLFEESTKLWLSVFATIIISVVYLKYRKDLKERDDWMRHDQGKFNVAGWYHFVYFILQTLVIIISLILFYSIVWFWVLLLAYFTTTEYFPRLLKRTPN